MNPYHEAWTEFATCRQVGGDLWFQEFAGDRRVAKNICHTRCPVRLQCLDYAMRIERDVSTWMRIGIYGGMTPNDRRRFQAEWLADQTGSAA
jgi:hypothetical protein